MPLFFMRKMKTREHCCRETFSGQPVSFGVAGSRSEPLGALPSPPDTPPGLTVTNGVIILVVEP